MLIAALGDDTPFTIGTEAAGLQPRAFASFTQVRAPGVTALRCCAAPRRAAPHPVAPGSSPGVHPPPCRHPTRPPPLNLPPPQALEDMNDSRVLGGVHFRKSVEDGARLGRQVAAYVYARLDGAGQYMAAEA